MGLQFFHSYLLWGVSLFLLPVLIHFLRRRRIQIVRLPTYEFLLRTQRRIARRSQLKNWLLLALRISAVSLVAILAARPLLSKQGWAVGSSWSPVHLAIIIDNSASMAYRTGQGTRFELAKRVAERLIQRLSPQDKASVWATAEKESMDIPYVLGKRAALSRLASIRQSDAAGRPFRIIQEVMSRMTVKADRRSVIVLSDMARSDWEKLRIRGFRRIIPHTRIQFVRVAPESGTHDVVVRDVRLRPWPPRANAPFAVVIRIANQGDLEREKVQVSLYVEEKKMGNVSLDLKGQEEKEVSFRVLAPEEGILRGRIELTPDQLVSTNHHYFSAEMGRRNRVLVIDGDPRRGLVESESFYISNALRAAPPGGNSPVRVEVVAGYEMGSVDWERYDLVIACNVEKWPAKTADLLRRFVERGGGLIWASGALAGQTVPGEGWLPAVPGTPQRIKPSQGPVVPSGSQNHPVFSKMGSNPTRLFSRIRLRRISPLKSVGNGRVLLTLQDGRAILVVGRAGVGRVGMWGSTCDREWTDIPVRPVFVPFMRGLVDFLGSGAEGIVTGITAGEPIEIRAKAHRVGEVVQIRSPSGAEETLRLKRSTNDDRMLQPPSGRMEPEGGAVVARFTGTFQAG
ncbi:MAG: BatA domain-containing protein, partial [bacterium]